MAAERACAIAPRSEERRLASFAAPHPSLPSISRLCPSAPQFPRVLPFFLLALTGSDRCPIPAPPPSQLLHAPANQTHFICQFSQPVGSADLLTRDRRAAAGLHWHGRHERGHPFSERWACAHALCVAQKHDTEPARPPALTRHHPAHFGERCAMHSFPSPSFCLCRPLGRRRLVVARPEASALGR